MRPAWMPGSMGARGFVNRSEGRAMCLRLDAEGEILAHGYGGFEVLLALLAHELSPKMRWPENRNRAANASFYDLRQVASFPFDQSAEKIA